MTTILVSEKSKQALMNKIQCLRDQSSYLSGYIASMDIARDICCGSPCDVQFSDNQPAEFSDSVNAEFECFSDPA